MQLIHFIRFQPHTLGQLVQILGFRVGIQIDSHEGCQVDLGFQPPGYAAHERINIHRSRKFVLYESHFLRRDVLAQALDDVPLLLVIHPAIRLGCKDHGPDHDGGLFIGLLGFNIGVDIRQAHARRCGAELFHGSTDDVTQTTGRAATTSAASQQATMNIGHTACGGWGRTATTQQATEQIADSTAGTASLLTAAPQYRAEPRAQSPEPRAQSPEPRAQSPEYWNRNPLKVRRC